MASFEEAKKGGAEGCPRVNETNFPKVKAKNELRAKSSFHTLMTLENDGNESST
jgi:hypothetical protein